MEALLLSKALPGTKPRREVLQQAQVLPSHRHQLRQARIVLHGHDQDRFNTHLAARL